MSALTLCHNAIVPRHRPFAGFVLALVMLIAPVAADMCLFFCGAPNANAHERTACHHADAVGTDARVEPATRPCGHDHGRGEGTIAARDDSPSASRASSSVPGFGLPASLFAPDSSSASIAVKSLSLQPPHSDPARLTPLRI
jgi:hypothetical protein